VSEHVNFPSAVGSHLHKVNLMSKHGVLLLVYRGMEVKIQAIQIAALLGGALKGPAFWNVKLRHWTGASWRF
jgi:hypothetical protein